MNNAKAKDRILAEIKAGAHHREIEGLRKVLPELETEGYVDVLRDEQHKPIRVKLSDKGRYFVSSGGYKKQRKTEIKASARKAAKWILVTLAGAALVELATLLVKQWLSK